MATAAGKHSETGKGNIYAKANEVIVKITGADTNQTFEVVEENCKPGFQSRAHYHIKAYETFYVFDGSADFQVGDEMFHAKKGSCVHIPPGVVHQVRHPLDELDEELVELGHLARAHPQRHVRVLPDLRERLAPDELALAIARRVVVLVVLVVVVLVIVLVVVVVGHRVGKSMQGSARAPTRRRAGRAGRDGRRP